MDRRELLGALRVRDPAGRTCTQSGGISSTSLAEPDEVEVGGRLRVAESTTTMRARRGCAALRGVCGQSAISGHFVAGTVANRAARAGGAEMGWPTPAGCRPQIERPARGRSGAAALTSFCGARASERRSREACTCDAQRRVHASRSSEACTVKGENAGLASSLTLRVS